MCQPIRSPSDPSPLRLNQLPRLTVACVAHTAAHRIGDGAPHRFLSRRSYGARMRHPDRSPGLSLCSRGPARSHVSDQDPRQSEAGGKGRRSPRRDLGRPLLLSPKPFPALWSRRGSVCSCVWGGSLSLPHGFLPDPIFPHACVVVGGSCALHFPQRRECLSLSTATLGRLAAGAAPMGPVSWLEWVCRPKRAPTPPTNGWSSF